MNADKKMILRGISRALQQAGVLTVSASLTVFPVLSYATDLADVPLASQATTAVQPNILFVLDESGVKLRPISRMDDRNNGGEKGSYALGGIPSSYVGHPTDAARPGLKVAYQGHYPGSGWEARPNRHTRNPGGDGTPLRLGGTGRPDFFDLDEAAGGNVPAFAWESAGANGIPIKHAVDGVEHYDGNWGGILDANERLDYLVTYAIPSWDQQFGKVGEANAVFKPGWIGAHTLHGLIASAASPCKVAENIAVLLIL